MPMMTLSEIQAAKVNPLIAREAYEQAAKRLADVLDTKNKYEQKAFALFSGYLTLALALFGVASAIIKDGGLNQLAVGLLAAGALLMAGAICFILALLDRQYGSIGSSPDMWLEKGTIDGDDAVLAKMLAYITYYHQERIDVSIAANLVKATRIRLGIFVGICSPLAIVAALLAGGG